MRHHDHPGTAYPASPGPEDQPPPLPLSPTDRPRQRHPHGWLMWLMCLPMLALVGLLILTGAVGAGGVLYALACVGMMVAMMLWMNHAGGPRDR
ncbi:hypothetical protein BJF80_16680 [Serinicoccus sp. CUA-874]|uniref:hypothetical protein n=1 Tax=Serinicoccus sp. CUA-874 TaxID=1517939 RepID=UPI000966EE3B|nr:hypothetical protein [Serinicoccus sp. CUA-874]OLT17541.1 hypothetical protein BJF80_16680 [Serinicoccus sp. CUA-874]